MLSTAKLQIWWRNVGHDIVWEDMKPRMYWLYGIKCNIFRFRTGNTRHFAISGNTCLVNILSKHENTLAHQCCHSSQNPAWNYMFRCFQSLNDTLSKSKCWENKYHVSLEWFVIPTDNLPLTWIITLRWQWYAGTSRETVHCLICLAHIEYATAISVNRLYNHYLTRAYFTKA